MQPLKRDDIKSIQTSAADTTNQGNMVETSVNREMLRRSEVFISQNKIEAGQR